MSWSHLRSTPAVVVSLVLIGQIAGYHLIPSQEYLPDQRPLSEFKHDIDDWSMVGETPIDKEVQALLKADDSINRDYRSPSGERAFLSVAFYRTQRAGVSPHSPQVCLPGSGWRSELFRRAVIDLPGRPQSQVNYYIVRRGDQQSVVLYWYQTSHRVIANEYLAKLYLVADSLRYRRSDTWLVRVVAPMLDGNIANAEKAGIRFARAVYEPLTRYMPGPVQ